jgi:hypothetical protein
MHMHEKSDGEMCIITVTRYAFPLSTSALSLSKNYTVQMRNLFKMRATLEITTLNASQCKAFVQNGTN